MKCETCLVFVGQEAVYSLFAAVAGRDGAAALTVLEQQMRNGKDARQLLIELAGYCRSLMLFKAAPALDSPVLASFSRERLTEDGKKMPHARFVQLVELFYQAANDAKWSVDPRISAEMALLTACAMDAAGSPAATDSAVAAAAAPKTQRSQPVIAPEPQPAVKTEVAAITREKRPEGKAPQIVEQPEMESLMSDLMKRVEQGGKRSIKALLEDARMISYENGNITLLFQRAMIRERVERDDVRKWLEELLAQLVQGTGPLALRG